MSTANLGQGQSPNSSLSLLQNLIESQEAAFKNLDTDINRLYLIINQRKNDIDFEVLYPIIPGYFWSCPEGLKLRTEIDSKLLANFK